MDVELAIALTTNNAHPASPSNQDLAVDLRSASKANHRRLRPKYPRPKYKSPCRSRSCCKVWSSYRHQAHIARAREAKGHAKNTENWDDGWEIDTIWNLEDELYYSALGEITWKDRRLMQRGRLAAWGLFGAEGDIDEEEGFEEEGTVVKADAEEKIEGVEAEVEVNGETKEAWWRNSNDVWDYGWVAEWDVERQGERDDTSSRAETDKWSMVSGDDGYDFV